MEKLILNGIEQKGQLYIVALERPGTNTNFQASMGKWQSTDADFLAKDVGIRGEFEGEIQIKGQYTNLTKVNMAAGTYKSQGNVIQVSNNVGIPTAPTNVSPTVPSEATGLVVKNDVQQSIEAQCITKLLCDMGITEIENDADRITLADQTIALFHYVKEKI